MAQSKTSQRSTGGMSAKQQRIKDIEDMKCSCLGRFNPGTGADWKAKVSRKKTKASHTAGRTKGKQCVADIKQRYMARTSRSYKHRNYVGWLAWCANVN